MVEGEKGQRVSGILLAKHTHRLLPRTLIDKRHNSPTTRLAIVHRMRPGLASSLAIGLPCDLVSKHYRFTNRSDALSGIATLSLMLVHCMNILFVMRYVQITQMTFHA